MFVPLLPLFLSHTTHTQPYLPCWRLRISSVHGRRTNGGSKHPTLALELMSLLLSACGLCRFSYSNDGRFFCVCAGARCATYASSFSGEYWIAFATCTAFKWQHFPIYFLCDGLVRRHSLIFAKNSPSAISVNHRDAISRRQTGVGTNVLRSKANPVSIRRPFSSHTRHPHNRWYAYVRAAHSLAKLFNS